jgi:hypothetical protein
MKSLLQTYLATTASLLLLTASSLSADPLKAVVIGTVDQAAGQAWLEQELLQTRFRNGDPIEDLLVRQYHDGYHLLRLGKSATGACRSESIPLQLSGNQLIATAVRWFTICDSPSCDGFCMPNSARSGCDCHGIEELPGDSDQLDDFDVENNHSSDDGPAQCNFGIDVSGMGLTTILAH